MKNRIEHTVPKVLREYERLGVTRLSDNQYHVRYRLTSKQKAILNELDIDESDYIAFADKAKDHLNNKPNGSFLVDV